MMRTTLCLAAICVIASLGCLPKADQQAADAEQLTLLIRTDPKGATVFIDGQKQEAATPCEVTLDKGAHMLGVQYPGYEPAWRRIPPQTAPGPLTLTIDDLELRPKTTPVILTTVPKGAFVQINGQDRGTTPVFLSDMRLGEHQVQFQFKAGFAPVNLTIDVKEGEPMIVNRVLESILGSIRVVTEADCEIYLNGTFRGRTSRQNRSLQIDEAEEGKYLLVVKKTGHKDLQQEFVLERQEEKLIAMPAMQQLPGTLVVTSQPAGARILRDGRPIGIAPITLEDEPASEIVLRFELDQYDATTETFTVVPGMRKTVSATLTKNVGGFMLITEPPGCDIYVNGKKVGETQASGAPNVSKLFEYDGLEPGRYMIRIDKPGYKPVQAPSLISKGEISNFGTIQLEEEWRPTHLLKTRNDTKILRVKLLGRTADGYQVEYFKGTARITFEVRSASIEMWQPIE